MVASFYNNNCSFIYFGVIPMWINDYKMLKNIIKGKKNEEEIKTSKNNLNLTIISSFI